MAPIISMGRLRMGENPSRGFSLKTPRDYRGRVGAAIPSGGIILPEAKNGQSPVTHSIANLPVGLAFDATTRAITGSPTGTYTTREVTYTATDSSTPAEVVNVTFQFPVVGSTALITRDDWDNRGYGLETRTTYLLFLLESESDVGFSDDDLWRRPPASGTETGLLLDDDGNTITDYSDMTFTQAGEALFIERVLIQSGTDRVVFYKSGGRHFGEFVREVLGPPTPSIFMRVGNDEQEVPYSRAFRNDYQCRRTSPDLGASCEKSTLEPASSLPWPRRDAPI